MAGEWAVLPLEDCMEAIIDYRGKTPEKTASGIPLITAKVVKGGRIETPDEFIAVGDYDEWMRRGIPNPGDVVVTTEAPLGEVAQLGTERVALAQRLIALRGKPGLLNNGFLKFLMQSEDVQGQLRTRATGTTVLGIKQSELRKVLLSLPPFDEQRAIAHILGTLDDKIELNRRMSETLEAMARALFTSWFVDFDPVRAKMDGRWRRGKSLPGLPAHLFDLFPSRLVNSDLGEIPEGWEARKLGDLLELAYGAALKAEDRREGNVPVYGSNGQVGWHNEPLVAGPGIVVGRKGNPGIATWVPTDFFPIDTTFYVVPKSNCRSLEFLFQVLRSHDLASLGADSAVPGLNRNLAYMSNQLLPPSPLVEHFERIAGALSRRAHYGNDEARTLATLRDALLPKLIAGQVRVGTGQSDEGQRGQA